MGSQMKNICSDLGAEYQALHDLVSGLNENKWYFKTPFFQWTIFDEVAHIAFFDHEALLAVEDPVRFKARSRKIMEIVVSSDPWPEQFNRMLEPETPDTLLSYWYRTRTRLLEHFGAMKPGDRLPWYGPDMSVRSFATARLMETWAHSQDIFDTLKKKRRDTNRLRHVAHIGVNTFQWSFKLRNLTVPSIGPRVELSSPDGGQWEWGQPDATNRVWGSARDFCLVVTQRRNVADTRLKWQGKHAGQWLAIAQAFAGIPQDGPIPAERVF
ncbi:TIGR03084 family protein [Desulfocicer vacuolatum DSM 3385]|uniref:TIGR03084 family protein n=2 Tax=Desulfocicer vacuolatum TaxID=2298 RepID=A0A1W2AGN4_9BACT|nr:TIGR03084 family protein [Desulfocicer vacuolatum DSM 3385]